MTITLKDLTTARCPASLEDGILDATPNEEEAFSPVTVEAWNRVSCA